MTATPRPQPQQAGQHQQVEQPERPITVLIVDDQHLVRSGFAMILAVEDDIDVVGDAPDGRAAIAAARDLRPDIVLMDVQMPVLDGIAATAQIVAEDLSRVVILTTFDRDDYLFDALDAGASGFLLKNADPDHLVEAVRTVASGHALLAPEVTRRVIERRFGTPRPAPHDATPGIARPGGTPPDGPSPGTSPGTSRPDAGAPGAERRHAAAVGSLTEREREVLGFVAKGLSNAEIAAELFLGEATVKTHVSNCLAKLQLRDRVQAVVFAFEAGLILPGDEAPAPR